MALRKGHGTGKGTPRIEILPVDELPAFLPVEVDPVTRRPDGTVADSASAKALGAKGGLAKAKRNRLIASLGLADIPDAHTFAPYAEQGNDFAKAQLASLASICGGEVGPGPASFITTGALQFVMSRWITDRGIELSDPDMMKKGSMVANDSRTSIMAGHELALKEAHARKALKAPTNPLDAWMAPEETSK